ncbi:MAG: 2-hydroxyacyl-CoA dehydratase family protein [Desulfobulbaceae bacterium]|jgi:benzoyl-CoA reductase/2-hydroxyglutaryl-CoA dehydratase subunit BcrC/BadD/HgdB|nr:2-hydroxyacyl-CoA dehydratase family protein [Desulfobulbaceae bacterium]
MQLQSLDRVNNYFETNALRIADAKEKGNKVVGIYCIYAPAEIILAADAICVSLCGTKQDSIPAAESVLPRTLCPLIKSSYGFLVNDSCPYLAASDLVIGETTCDGKKKMFEIMAADKNLFVMHLPYDQASEMALTSWQEQFHLLVARLEQDLSARITREKLLAAIAVVRRERQALKRVFDSAKHKPAPVTGMQLLELAFKTSFLPDKEEGISLLNAVADELETRIKTGQSPFTDQTPRIILTGVPTGMGSHKVVALLEECGASVVCIDNCVGYKKTRIAIDAAPDASQDEIIAALAKRYLAIPCSVMTPNPNRFATLKELALDFAADAVVDLSWQGCHTYNVEARAVKEFVNTELGLPCLRLESDYSTGDSEQLRTRIEAFLEMLPGKK